MSQRPSLRSAFRMLLAFVLALGAPGVALAQEAEQPADTAQAQTPAASTYRINPGDQLEIYVWGEERLQQSLRVLPDGTIAFPLVGQLKVAGFLPQQVEEMVSTGLRSQYRGEVPSVTVSVTSTDGMQFSVLGKVRSPGSFTVGRYVTVLEALSLAGGPAEFANLGRILVITHRGDQVVTMNVKLDDLFRGGAGMRDVERANIVQVMPGDIIIVP